MDLDPELAWALQLSTQTYEQENKPPGERVAQPAAATADVVMPDVGGEDDPELLEAIRMSLMSTQAPTTTTTTQQPATTDQSQSHEDDELLRAIELSQQPQVAENHPEEKPIEPKTEATTTSTEKTESSTQAATQDPTHMDLDFGALDPSVLESIVMNLPDVDINDPVIQQFLKNYKEDKEKK